MYYGGKEYNKEARRYYIIISNSIRWLKMPLEYSPRGDAYKFPAHLASN